MHMKRHQTLALGFPYKVFSSNNMDVCTVLKSLEHSWGDHFILSEQKPSLTVQYPQSQANQAPA